MLITTFMLKSFLILTPDSNALPSFMDVCDKPFGLGFNFIMTEVELWKPIPLTNNEYDISNFGRMRSWLKKGSMGVISDIPRILKTPLNRNGYPSAVIFLRELNHKKTIRTHRLVAENFIDNPNNMPHVLHKDDDKTNSHYSNLEWGNHLKNMQDAFIRKMIVPAKGEARKKSKLTNSDVEKIFKLKGKEGCCFLAKKYGVNHTCISDIWTGRTWNHITGLLCTRKLKPKFSKDVKFI